MSGSPFASQVRRYRAGIRHPGRWKRIGVAMGVFALIWVGVIELTGLGNAPHRAVTVSGGGYNDFFDNTIDGKPMNDGDEPIVFGKGNVAWPHGWTDAQAKEWRRDHRLLAEPRIIVLFDRGRLFATATIDQYDPDLTSRFNVHGFNFSGTRSVVGQRLVLPWFDGKQLTLRLTYEDGGTNAYGQVPPPMLWGDGLHDDAPALNALFKGGEADTSEAERNGAVIHQENELTISGGSFYVRRPLVVARDYVSVTNCMFLIGWPWTPTNDAPTGDFVVFRYNTIGGGTGGEVVFPTPQSPKANWWVAGNLRFDVDGKPVRSGK